MGGSEVVGAVMGNSSFLCEDQKCRTAKRPIIAHTTTTDATTDVTIIKWFDEDGDASFCASCVSFVGDCDTAEDELVNVV